MSGAGGKPEPGPSREPELLTELLEALKRARPYVRGAYECAFPDEDENVSVLEAVDAAIAKASR